MDESQNQGPGPAAMLSLDFLAVVFSLALTISAKAAGAARKEMQVAGPICVCCTGGNPAQCITSNFPASSSPGCLSEMNIKHERGERSSQTREIPLMGHKESLHVQVLAGDAAEQVAHLTVIRCHQGDRAKSALAVMAGTHR